MPKPSKDPVASLVMPATAKAGESVNLDMSASHDPNGFIRGWELEFGNGNNLRGDGQPKKAAYVWNNPGKYNVVLAVFDNTRHQVTTSQTIEITQVVPEPLPDPLTISVPDVEFVFTTEPQVVTYPAPVVAGGVNPTVSFEPPETTPLPFGTTEIKATARSEDGQVAETWFKVRIRETLELILPTVPSTLATEEPAQVDFVIETEGGIEPVVIEQNPNTHFFPFGTTTVNVTARSADGQETSGSFDVVVEQDQSGQGGGEGEQDYFTRMSLRPDFAAGARLGSQAELDTLKPPQKPANYPALAYQGGSYPASDPYDETKAVQKKRPAVYDPVENAALFVTQPDITTDTQQVYFKLKPYAPGDTVVLVQDMKLDENWLWRREIVDLYGEEQFNRLKAQQMRGPNNGPWSTRRTFFDHAYRENERVGFATNWVAEWVGTSNNATRMFPPLSWTENEIIMPRQGEPFFTVPNIWAREVVQLKYAGLLREWTQTPLSTKQQEKVNLPPTDKDSWYNAHVVLMSVWYSDETRAARQTLVDVPIILEYPDQINVYAMENDTGQDKVRPTYENGVKTHEGDTRLRKMWMRNFLQFLNPDPATFNEILEQPQARIGAV